MNRVGMLTVLDLLPSGLYRRLRPFTESTLKAHPLRQKGSRAWLSSLSHTVGQELASFLKKALHLAPKIDS
jgi:hypothetical protein